MTPLATGSQKQLALQPATMAGLRSAITSTHDAVTSTCRRTAGSRADALARVSQHLRAATETLAASTAGPGTHTPPAQPPDSVLEGVSGSDLAEMCNESIALAVEVLGNEDEPLTPFDVLAVTRAVTALCAARTCAQEVGQ